MTALGSSNTAEPATHESWRASVLTVRPELYPGPLGAGLFARARARGIWQLETIDIAEFASDRHRSVDDTPAGGGPGMIMRVDVAARALDSLEDDARPRLLLTPRGSLLRQSDLEGWARGSGVILVCSRFAGVDERLIATRALLEISLGDFILAGGDVAAMAVVEGCVRLLPGVVGSPASLVGESFHSDLLEHPQYTRPTVFEGKSIPPILLSGDHSRIAKWRHDQARRDTAHRRPDLWDRHMRKRKIDGPG